LWLFCF